jgi:hypothetical protein
VYILDKALLEASTGAGKKKLDIKDRKAKSHLR